MIGGLGYRLILMMGLFFAQRLVMGMRIQLRGLSMGVFRILLNCLIVIVLYL